MKYIISLATLFLGMQLYGQSFNYDNLNRLTTVSYGDSITIEYCYDELGNRTCYNVAGGQQTQSDLLISNLVISSSSICQSANFVLSYTEENIGTGDSESYISKIYLSDDPIISSEDILLESPFTNGLETGQSLPREIPLSLPEDIIPGTKHILVVLDTDNLVSELSEENNESSSTITVSSDLGFDFNVNVVNTTCNESNGTIQITSVTGQSPISYQWAHDANLNSSMASNLGVGSYYVTITDASGCEEVESNHISNNDVLPVSSFIYEISSDTVFLYAVGGEADSYTYTIDGQMYASVQDTFYIHNESENEVCLQVANSCGNDSYCLFINSDAVDCQNPTSIYLTESDDNSITFEWNNVSSNGLYNIRYKVPGSSCFTYIQDINSDSYHLQNWYSEDPIQIQVQSDCYEHIDLWSDYVVFSTLDPNYYRHYDTFKKYYELDGRFSIVNTTDTSILCSHENVLYMFDENGDLQWRKEYNTEYDSSSSFDVKGDTVLVYNYVGLGPPTYRRMMKYSFLNLEGDLISEFQHPDSLDNRYSSSWAKFNSEGNIITYLDYRWNGHDEWVEFIEHSDTGDAIWTKKISVWSQRFINSSGFVETSNDYIFYGNHKRYTYDVLLFRISKQGEYQSYYRLDTGGDNQYVRDAIIKGDSLFLMVWADEDNGFGNTNIVGINLENDAYDVFFDRYYSEVYPNDIMFLDTSLVFVGKRDGRGFAAQISMEGEHIETYSFANPMYGSSNQNSAKSEFQSIGKSNDNIYISGSVKDENSFAQKASIFKMDSLSSSMDCWMGVGPIIGSSILTSSGIENFSTHSTGVYTFEGTDVVDVVSLDTDLEDNFYCSEGECSLRANFEILPDTICLNTSIVLYNTGVGFESTKWYIDNQYHDSTTNLLYEFKSPGEIEFKLVASNNECSDSLTKSVFVRDFPFVSVEINAESCVNPVNSIQVDVEGNNESFNFNWSNGSIEPFLESIAVGEYSLNISDDNYCSLDTIINVELSEMSKYSVHTLCPGDSLEIFVPDTLYRSVLFSDSDYLLVRGNDLQLNDLSSIEVYLKVDSTNMSQSFMSVGSLNKTAFLINEDAEIFVIQSYTDNANMMVSDTIETSLELELGNWTYLYIEFDSLQIAIKSDWDTFTFPIQQSVVLDSFPDFTLGGSLESDNFSGSIDEVRLWGCSLTSEVRSDWNKSTVINSHPFYSELIAYWNFNNSSFLDMKNGVELNVEVKQEKSTMLSTNTNWGSIDYGSSVAVYEDFVVVSAPRESQSKGAVYVYKKDGLGDWGLVQKITPGFLGNGDEFGASLSLNNRFLIIGAIGDDDNGANSGAVYVYELINEDFIFKEKIIGSDVNAGDRFGYSSDIYDDRIVVSAIFGGSSGKAYLYSISDNTMDSEVIFDNPVLNSNSQFGYSVSMGNDIVCIGAPFSGNNGTNSGMTFYTEFQNSAWQELMPFDFCADYADQFGRNLDINEEVVLVGVPGESKMLVFDRLSKAIINSFEVLNYNALAISDKIGIVGDQYYDGFANNAGVSYILSKDNVWKNDYEYIPNGVTIYDQFGSSASIHNSRVVVGAKDGENAYILEIPEYNFPIHSFDGPLIEDLNYVWSNGERGLSTVVYPNESSTYSVIYDDLYSHDHVINVNDDLSVSLSLDDPTCNGYNDGNVQLDITNPLDHDYEIEWSYPDISSAGDYNVTVTDLVTGCSYIEEFQLVDPAPLVVQVAKEEESACGRSDGYANAVVVGGTAPYTYQWSQNEGTTSMADSLQGGFYMITVTDANGCSISESVIIGTKEGDNYEFDIQLDESSCTINREVAVIPEVVDNYSYQWSSEGETITLEHDFDEQSSSLAYDNINGSYSRTLGNATVDGILSIGYNSSDHLQMDPSLFHELNDFEFSCDFKLNAINSGLNTIISVSSEEYDNGLLVGCRPDGKVWVFIHAVGKLFGSNLDFALDQWHNIVVRRVGSELEVLFNNQSLGIQSSPSVSILSDYACLGQEQDEVGGGFASNQSLNGSLDNVRLTRLNKSTTNSLENALAGPHFVKIQNEDGCETMINTMVSTLSAEIEDHQENCKGDSTILNLYTIHSNEYENKEYQLVEELILDFSKPISESISTESGSEYVVLANGHFTVWNGCKYLEDRIKYFDPAFSYNNELNSQSNRNLMVGAYASSRPTMDQTNTDGNYVYHILSDGSPIEFSYNDINYNETCQCYYDNCGYFRVSIYKIVMPEILWSDGSSSDSLSVFEADSVSVIVSTTNYECHDTIEVRSTNVLMQESIDACIIEDELVSFQDLNNHSLDINANNEMIVVPNDPSLQITGDLSIEMWLHPQDYSQRRNPINKAYGGEYTITHEPSGRLTFFHGTSGINAHPYHGFVSNNSIPLNEWSHVVAVRDYSVMKERWYINGVLDRERGFAWESNTASEFDVIIGEGYVHGYVGKIDEVRIWNTALTQDEIASWKNQTITEDHPSYNHLMLYHQFDQSEDGIYLDSSPEKNDGYVQGSVEMSNNIPAIKNNDYFWADGVRGNERQLGSLSAGYHAVTLDNGTVTCSDSLLINDIQGTIIWIADNGSWSEVTNWDKQHLPLRCEDVILRAINSSSLEVTLDSNYTSQIRSLKIEEGVTLITDGNLYIENSNSQGIELESNTYLTNNGVINISYAELESILCSGHIINHGTINIHDYDPGPILRLNESCIFNIKGGGPVILVKE